LAEFELDAAETESEQFVPDLGQRPKIDCIFDEEFQIKLG
jgi:hypothetical protein